MVELIINPTSRTAGTTTVVNGTPMISGAPMTGQMFVTGPATGVQYPTSVPVYGGGGIPGGGMGGTAVPMTIIPGAGPAALPVGGGAMMPGGVSGTMANPTIVTSGNIIQPAGMNAAMTGGVPMPMPAGGMGGQAGAVYSYGGAGMPYGGAGFAGQPFGGAGNGYGPGMGAGMPMSGYGVGYGGAGYPVQGVGYRPPVSQRIAGDLEELAGRVIQDDSMVERGQNRRAGRLNPSTAQVPMAKRNALTGRYRYVPGVGPTYY